MPVARRRSISAQSSGAEQRHHRPRLLLDPAKGGDVVVRAEQDPRLARPGLGREVGLPLDEPCVSLGEPARHVRGAAVAHRAAQHRQREPVDLEEEDPRHVRARRRRPGASRSAGRPAACTCRRRSSPKTTSRTTLTAAATSAASSAQPKLSTVMHCGADLGDAASSMTASSTRTITKPSSAMNGSRSAATIGGRTRVQDRDQQRRSEGAPKPSTETPGTSVAATSSAAAPSSHASTTRSGPVLGPLRMPGDRVAERRLHHALTLTPGLVGSSRDPRAHVRRARDRASWTWTVFASSRILCSATVCCTCARPGAPRRRRSAGWTQHSSLTGTGTTSTCRRSSGSAGSCP